MTVDEFLRNGTAELTAHGIDSARLDCLILLEDILNKNRTQLLAHPEIQLTPVQQASLCRRLARRAAHEPLAYIRKSAAFYGRTFYVDKRVLVPRPETEALIDLVLRLPLPAGTAIIDVGTGSGAIAVTAKLEMPWATVTGTDSHDECLQVASHNAAQLHADVTFRHGNLLEPVSDILARGPTLLLCNLPYVPLDHPVNRAVAHEPPSALYAGTDGLRLYAALFAQLKQLGARPLYIGTESMPAQHAQLAGMAHYSGYNLSHTSGFVQMFAPHA